MWWNLSFLSNLLSFRVGVNVLFRTILHCIRLAHGRVIHLHGLADSGWRIAKSKWAAQNSGFTDRCTKNFRKRCSSHLWWLGCILKVTNAFYFLLTERRLFSSDWLAMMKQSRWICGVEIRTSYVSSSDYFSFSLCVFGICARLGCLGFNRHQSLRPPYSFGKLFSMPWDEQSEAQVESAFGY